MRSFSSYSCTRKLATIQCLVLLQPHHLSIPYPLSFASLDTPGNEIAESPWLTDYYNNRLQVQVKRCHYVRAMLACSIWSSSASSSSIIGWVPGWVIRVSRVDVVLLFRLISSIVRSYPSV